jgi:hypothetical protein
MREKITPQKRKMISHNGKELLHLVKVTEWNDKNNTIALQYHFVEAAIEDNIPLRLGIVGEKDVRVLIQPEQLITGLKKVSSFDDKLVKGTKHHIYYYPMPKVFRKHLNKNQLNLFEQ